MDILSLIALALLSFLLWNYVVLPELWDKFFVSPVRPFEKLIFFPTIGFPSTEDGSYRIPLRAWVYQEQSRLGKIQQYVAEYFASPNPEDRRRLTDNTSWLVYKNRRCAQISIAFKSVDGQTVKHRFAKLTGPNGHVHEDLILPKELSSHIISTQNGIFQFRALLDDGDDRVILGEATLLKPEGISIISDIDDTIKITNIANKKELVKNTFSRAFQAVPGMPELYKRWQSSLAAHNVSFHFVSGSPWQLFSSLKQFMQDAKGLFPRGSFHLKNFRFKDRNLLALFSDPFAYKWKIIEPIFMALPNRKFILVGDSGEKDPEIYAALAKKFPSQVLHIFIRRVDSPQDSPQQTTPSRLRISQPKPVITPEQRLQQVFADIPPERVTVFRSPLEDIDDSRLDI